MPSPHPLAGARAKLGRGREHLNHLKDEIAKATINPKPALVTVTGKLDVETNEWVATVSDVFEPPVLWSLLVGDCVHNLRSALDHLVWELAFVDNGGVDPAGGKNQFPIVTTGITEFTNKAPLWLEGVSKGHRALIERYQPYISWKGSGDHPLKLLSDIDNDDKHRMVQPTLMAPAGIDLRFPHVGKDCHVAPGSIKGTITIDRPLEVNTEILRIPVVVTGPNPQMPMHAESPMYIGFRNGVNVDTSLTLIGNFIERVIKRFQPFLESKKARNLWRPRESRFQTTPPEPHELTLTVSDIRNSDAPTFSTVKG